MEHTANPLVREVVLEVIEKRDKRIKKQEPSADLLCRRLRALGIDGYFGKYEYIMSFMLDTRS